MKLCLYLIVLTISIPSTVFSLQAPYLIDATVRSQGSIGLTWQNNSIDYDSIYILKKSDVLIYYDIDTVVEGTVSSIVDTNLSPSHVYIYALIAKNQSEISDTSNTDTATTLAWPCSSSVVNPLDKAIMNVNWDYENLYARITYIDSFCDENKLEIYRGEEGKTPLLLAEWSDVSMNTNVFTQKSINDTPPSLNHWYYYYSRSSYSGISNSSNTFYQKSADTIFTLDPATFFKHDTLQIVTKTVLSTYPISTGTDSSVWAVKHGDSMWIKESDTADSLYSIVNITDPANPIFEGYREYPIIHFGYAPMFKIQRTRVCQNRFFIGTMLYSITDNGPVVIKDSIPNMCLFYNDSIILISKYDTDSSFMINVNESGIIDTISFLSIGDTGDTIYSSSYGSRSSGHYSDIYGPYHDMLFKYYSFSESYPFYITVNYEYITSIQYLSDSKSLYTGTSGYENKSSLPIVPRLINGYIPGDSLFIKAKYAYLDTALKIAYLVSVSDSNLTICNYELTPNIYLSIKQSSLSTAHGSSFRAVYNNNHVTVTIPGDYSKGKIVVLDIKGRTLCETNITGKKEICLPVISLTNGVYFIALQSAKGRQFTKFIVGR